MEPIEPIEEGQHSSAGEFSQVMMNRANRRIGFTAGQTQGFINRILRQVERSQIWKPDVGGLSPAMVDHFNQSVIQRYPSFAEKFAVETSKETIPEGEALDLPPASPLGYSGLGFDWSDEAPPERLVEPIAPEPSPSLAEEPAKPKQTIVAAPTIQRKAGVRPVSRVEEIHSSSDAAPTRSNPVISPDEGEASEQDAAQAVQNITSEIISRMREDTDTLEAFEPTEDSQPGAAPSGFETGEAETRSAGTRPARSVTSKPETGRVQRSPESAPGAATRSANRLRGQIVEPQASSGLQRSTSKIQELPISSPHAPESVPSLSAPAEPASVTSGKDQKVAADLSIIDRAQRKPSSVEETTGQGESRLVADTARRRVDSSPVEHPAQGSGTEKLIPVEHRSFDTAQTASVHPIVHSSEADQGQSGRPIPLPLAFDPASMQRVVEEGEAQPDLPGVEASSTPRESLHEPIEKDTYSTVVQRKIEGAHPQGESRPVFEVPDLPISKRTSAIGSLRETSADLPLVRVDRQESAFSDQAMALPERVSALEEDRVSRQIEGQEIQALPAKETSLIQENPAERQLHAIKKSTQDAEHLPLATEKSQRTATDEPSRTPELLRAVEGTQPPAEANPLPEAEPGAVERPSTIELPAAWELSGEKSPGSHPWLTVQRMPAAGIVPGQSQPEQPAAGTLPLVPIPGFTVDHSADSSRAQRTTEVSGSQEPALSESVEGLHLLSGLPEAARRAAEAPSAAGTGDIDTPWIEQSILDHGAGEQESPAREQMTRKAAVEQGAEDAAIPLARREGISPTDVAGQIGAPGPDAFAGQAELPLATQTTVRRSVSPLSEENASGPALERIGETAQQSEPPGVSRESVRTPAAAVQESSHAAQESSHAAQESSHAAQESSHAAQENTIAPREKASNAGDPSSAAQKAESIPGSAPLSAPGQAVDPAPEMAHESLHHPPARSALKRSVVQRSLGAPPEEPAIPKPEQAQPPVDLPLARKTVDRAGTREAAGPETGPAAAGGRSPEWGEVNQSHSASEHQSERPAAENTAPDSGPSQAHTAPGPGFPAQDLPLAAHLQATREPGAPSAGPLPAPKHEVMTTIRGMKPMIQDSGMSVTRAGRFSPEPASISSPDPLAILPQARSWPEPETEESVLPPAAPVTPFQSGGQSQAQRAPFPVQRWSRTADTAGIPAANRQTTSMPLAASPAPTMRAVDLPLARPSAAAGSPIQRVVTAATNEEAAPARAEMVQSSPQRSSESAKEKEAKVDLDELARKIYPLIKRMLAIERERFSGR